MRVRQTPILSCAELPLTRLRSFCSVSLLTNFELCDTYLDWDLDTHGIYIQLPNPALGAPAPAPPAPPATLTSLPPSTVASSTSLSPTPQRSSYRSISALPPFHPPKPADSARGHPRVLTATYLPDVATQQGWSKVEAVDSAIRKAGWSGKVTEEMRKGCRVTRYQSGKVEVKFAEWKEWRGV